MYSPTVTDGSSWSAEGRFRLGTGSEWPCRLKAAGCSVDLDRSFTHDFNGFPGSSTDIRHIWYDKGEVG